MKKMNEDDGTTMAVMIFVFVLAVFAFMGWIALITN